MGVMRRLSNYAGWKLAGKPAEQLLFPRLAIYFRQGLRQGDSFGASHDAILRVGAIFDAAVAHRGCKAFFGMHFSGWMHVEETHLAENCGAHELIVLVHLRTDFQTISAGD